MRIYLIGMPGSGKSTVATHLAKALNMKEVDLDSKIEENALAFIDHIFEFLGEDTFRKLETEALESINEDDVVVACGGGVVERKENKALMQGIKIYLDTDLEIIENRIRNEPIRPLLKTQALEQIYDRRFLKYQHFADVNINNNYGINETVEAIMTYLRNENLL